MVLCRFLLATSERLAHYDTPAVGILNDLASAQRAHSKLQKPPSARGSLRRGGRRD